LFAGLILAAGLFVFASVLNDSFSPVVYQSAVDGGGGGSAEDDGFDGGELRSDYDYRYGWSFVACSIAFLASEASAVFTITAYFRRLEDHVRYTAVDRKPSPDTPPPSTCDRSSSSACSAAPDSPDAADTTDLSVQPVQCGGGGGGGGDCNPAAASSASSSSGAVAEAACNGTVSKTPPDICPPKIGCCDETAAVKPPSASNHSAHKHQHPHHQHQHYRQALAVGGGHGPCYEVDTSKPCTCTSAAATTKRYATIAGVARHNGGKQYTTTTALATNNKRPAAVKESAAGLVDHHSAAAQQHQHHRKPDPPTRRLKASVGGYVVPQTPIAALEALDCPPIADPRLVLPSSV